MEYKNIIIGSGPAGLQMAYFFGKRNESYLLLDQSCSVGAFFKTFPRTRSLISINKVCTFPYREKSLRFDWNSLICDDESMQMSKFTEDFYPNADDLVKYLEAFSHRFNLRIEFNSRIDNIRRCPKTSAFELHTNSKTYKCERLFIGTGVQPKKVPINIMEIGKKLNIPVFEYGTVSLDPKTFRNKSVFIVGTGNAAFEVANFINDVTQSIAICGPAKPAWKTHYPGNLRSVNMKFFDTFYLKAGNVIYFNYDACEDIVFQYDEFLKACETRLHYIIYCGGFEANIHFLKHEVSPKCKNGFPVLTPYYESVNVPNMFFIGTLMQQHDFKRGTSAFIHGFRYNIEFLDRWLHNDIMSITLNGKRALLDHIMHRMKYSSDLYHRFGVFMDRIDLCEGNHTKSHDDITFQYTEGIPKTYSIHRNSHVTITIHFDYLPFSWELRQPDILVPKDDKISVYLHPIVQIYLNDSVKTFHVGESITGEFIHPIHREMFETYIDYALEEDHDNDTLRTRIQAIEERLETNQFYKILNGFDIEKNNKMSKLLASSVQIRPK